MLACNQPNTLDEKRPEEDSASRTDTAVVLKSREDSLQVPRMKQDKDSLWYYDRGDTIVTQHNRDLMIKELTSLKLAIEDGNDDSILTFFEFPISSLLLQSALYDDKEPIAENENVTKDWFLRHLKQYLNQGYPLYGLSKLDLSKLESKNKIEKTIVTKDERNPKVKDENEYSVELLAKSVIIGCGQSNGFLDGYTSYTFALIKGKLIFYAERIVG